MRRHGNLFGKIVDVDNLHLAAKKSLRGKRFKPSAASFYFHLENEILAMARCLDDESYAPTPYRVFRIHEPKERLICCAGFFDRVVHHGVINVLEPIFERRLIHGTYACRSGKGVHAALKKSREMVKRYDYWLKCDIRKYFDSIDHGILLGLLGRLFKDKKLLRLLEKIVSHQTPHTPAGRGLPIGNLTSQHFANIYLGELDLFVKHGLKCKGYIRYMDDFILFSDDKKILKDHLERMGIFLGEGLNLALKSKAIRLAPSGEGLPFLGHRVFRGTIRMRRENLVRFRRKVVRMERDCLAGKMGERDLADSVRSVIAHVSQGNTLNLRKRFFGVGGCQRGRSALSVAVPGTTIRKTCVPPIATTTIPRTGTTMWGSVS